MYIIIINTKMILRRHFCQHELYNVDIIIAAELIIKFLTGPFFSLNNHNLLTPPPNQSQSPDIKHVHSCQAGYYCKLQHCNTSCRDLLYYNTGIMQYCNRTILQHRSLQQT